ncbi:NVEALA domain-containing protein [Bacteroides hominis]|uniref:NVEALA domain-containing protein n=1 Tax=Bacteroides hominis TaxID=2763023 RepID=UPI003D6C6D43
MSYLSLIVAVVATFAGYNIYQSQRVEMTMLDLAMANDGEGGSTTIECGSDQTQVCYTIHVLNPETGIYYDHKIMGGRRI